MEITAILINVTGIQEYIFHSNKLKENIGASYIIENEIYENLMNEMLKDLFSDALSCDWKDNHAVKIESSPTIKCEIGYVGGGNALLLFKNEANEDKEDNSKTFVKAFSKAVLEQFPGLHLVFGKKTDFKLSAYKKEFECLMQDLKQRKSEYIPIVSIPKHGITADCPWSNDSAEIREEKDKQYISKASYAKIYATKIAQNNIKQKEMYPALGETYLLTEDIENLGQEKEASYIAVVHIDGNGMGSIFNEIETLPDLRKKSKDVSIKATEAMANLIKNIVSKVKIVQNNKKEDEYFIDNMQLFWDKKNKRTILPIRPILVGGDDITFICEGRLGMYLAEKFISLFFDEDAKSKQLMDGACAGVAIVKTHFPFYKSVQLAKELCDEAKNPSRTTKGSYISYYYSATTFSGSLKQLRERTHTTSDGKSMYFGPYLLFNPKEDNSIEELKKGIAFFSKNEKWANSKVMRLREVLVEPQSAQDLFKKEMNIGIDKTKGEITFSNDKTAIWESRKTPFFDQIELMDFYLPSLLIPIKS